MHIGTYIPATINIATLLEKKNGSSAIGAHVNAHDIIQALEVFIIHNPGPGYMVQPNTFD